VKRDDKGTKNVKFLGGFEREGYGIKDSFELKDKKPLQTGGIFSIATRDVLTVPPTLSIIGTARTMEKHGFRRLPITDAGTDRVMGIVTTVDIVNLLGGGTKYNLVKNRYQGNLLAAVNGDIKELMEKEVVCVEESETIKDAAKIMIERGIGGIPIIDKKLRIKGIITERDFAKLLIEGDSFEDVLNKKIEEYMSKNVVSAYSDETLGAALRKMLENGFRRLPIVKDDLLLGLVTATTVMQFLGSGKVFEKLVTGNASEIYDLEIKNIMKTDIKTIGHDADMREAAKKINKNDIGGFPVLKDGMLVGIFTETDLLRAIFDVLKSA
jgi:CBS domain-containing protein